MKETTSTEKYKLSRRLTVDLIIWSVCLLVRTASNFKWILFALLCSDLRIQCFLQRGWSKNNNEIWEYKT